MLFRSSIADLAKLDASALLQAARRAGVSVTVDCQCHGIFVNDRQVPGDPRGVPADVAPDLLAALSARVDELKASAESQPSCNGLFTEVPRRNGDCETKVVWVAASFEILGASRDPSGHGWGRWIRWRDADRRVHTC